VQVQDYEKDKEEDEGEVILSSLMGVPVRCKAYLGIDHVLVLVNVHVLENVRGSVPGAYTRTLTGVCPLFPSRLVKNGSVASILRV
jgi:hypothetical protein